jgi:hypothetical protein
MAVAFGKCGRECLSWPSNTAPPHTQFHLGFQHIRTPAAAILQ